MRHATLRRKRDYLDACRSALGSLLGQRAREAAGGPAWAARLMWSPHAQVRAFAGWPGTRHVFELRARDAGGAAQAGQALELKVLRTRVRDAPDPALWHGLLPNEVAVGPRRDALLVRCGGGARPGGAPADALEILEVQPATKRAASAAAFINGLQNRRLLHQAH